MSSLYANGLLTVLSILTLCILVFVLPLLHESIIYRATTLFAGLNIAIITLSIALHDWSVKHYVDWERLTKFLITTVPQFYIAFAIVGAIIIRSYILQATTTFRAMAAGIIGAVASYFIFALIANITGALIFMYNHNPLSVKEYAEIIRIIAVRIFQPDSLSMTITVVSSLVSMLSTVAIIQKTEHQAP